VNRISSLAAETAREARNRCCKYLDFPKQPFDYDRVLLLRVVYSFFFLSTPLPTRFDSLVHPRDGPVCSSDYVQVGLRLSPLEVLLDATSLSRLLAVVTVSSLIQNDTVNSLRSDPYSPSPETGVFRRTAEPLSRNSFSLLFILCEETFPWRNVQT